MKQSAAAMLAILGLAVTAGAQTWTIGERDVPPPDGASAELRESIERTPQPGSAGVLPAPDSREGWIESARSRDAGRAAAIEKRLESLPVTVSEASLNGVAVNRIMPDSVSDRFRGNLYMDLHGGAYVYGGGKAGLGEALLIAERLGIEVVAVDYRMPPLAEPFPAAVDDAVLAFLELLKTHDPASIAVGGTSAGGGLTLALVHRLKAIGAPLPGALYAGTAWADLTKTGDTLYTNEGLDRILVQYEGGLQGAAALYVGVSDWKDPLVSPVYGDFSGFPPTILTTGTRDLFLSDVARTHRKMRAAGVEAELHVYEAMSHAGYSIWPDTPESADMYAEVAAFLAGHLD